MTRDIADIGNFEQHLHGQLLVDSEVIGENLRLLIVRTVNAGDVAVRREAACGRELRGLRTHRRQQNVCNGCAALADDRTRCAINVVVRVMRAVKPQPAADDGVTLLVRVPCEAGAWLDKEEPSRESARWYRRIDCVPAKAGQHSRKWLGVS